MEQMKNRSAQVKKFEEIHFTIEIKICTTTNTKTKDKEVNKNAN